MKEQTEKDFTAYLCALGRHDLDRIQSTSFRYLQDSSRGQDSAGLSSAFKKIITNTKNKAPVQRETSTQGQTHQAVQVMENFQGPPVLLRIIRQHD